MDTVATDQPELRTPRRRLRESRADDADSVHAVHSDPRVMRHWRFPAGTQPDQARAKVASIVEERARGAACVWAVADADELVGSIAASAIGRVHGRAEVGYRLHADGRGRAVPGANPATAVIGFAASAAPARAGGQRA